MRKVCSECWKGKVARGNQPITGSRSAPPDRTPGSQKDNVMEPVHRAGRGNPPIWTLLLPPNSSIFLPPSGHPTISPSRRRGDTSRYLMHPMHGCASHPFMLGASEPHSQRGFPPLLPSLLLLLLPVERKGNRVGDNAATGGDLTCCLSPHNLRPCPPSRSTPLAGSPAPYFTSLPPSPAPDAPIWGASSTRKNLPVAHVVISPASCRSEERKRKGV
jgi:hypothetical protein